MFFQTNLTNGGGVQLFLRLTLLCAAFALALAGCASDGSDESAGSTTSTAGAAQNCYGMVGGDVFFSQVELVTAIRNASGTMTLQLGSLVENTDLEIIRMEINGNSNLSSVSLDLSNATSVTSIEDFAFSGCTKLASVTIPSSVTSIRQSAFSDCQALASVTIPSSVTSIGKYVFKSCTSLTSVTFENPNGWYKSPDATLDADDINGGIVDVSNAGNAAILLKGSLRDKYLLRKS